MIETKDIYWLAGLIEGEGCFGISKRFSQPSIALSMTDYDVVSRAALLLGRGDPHVVISKRLHPNGVNRLPMYVVAFAGRRAAAWMMTLYPLMGVRRKARIRQVLQAWLSLRKHTLHTYAGFWEELQRRAAEGSMTGVNIAGIIGYKGVPSTMIFHLKRMGVNVQVVGLLPRRVGRGRGENLYLLTGVEHVGLRGPTSYLQKIGD